MTESGDVRDVLAKLRERYLSTSGSTVTAFAELAGQLDRAPDAPEVVEALRRELHRVRGTAGSYGIHEASRLAAALEPVAVLWAGDRTLDRERRSSIVRQFVAALRAVFEEAAGAQAAMTSRLLLVDLPEDVAAGLTAEGTARGYRVEVVAPDSIDDVLLAAPAAAVIASASTRFVAQPETPVVLLRRAGEELSPQPENFAVRDVKAPPGDLLFALERRRADTPLSGASVLIIEDDEGLVRLLRAMAEQQGMTVESRADADDLVATVAQLQPSVVLMDVSLPGVSGLGATRSLREDPRFRDLPIIVMSAHTDVETRSTAFAAGADDFQSKPVSAEELFRRIERTLEVRQQRQVAAGVHPETGMLLRERTVTVFDSELVARAARADAASVAVLRPDVHPVGAAGRSAWYRVLRGLVQALAPEQVRIGFRDDTAALALLPFDAEAAVARLAPLATQSREGSIPWTVGLAELRPGAEPSALELSQLADEAWHLARDAGEVVRVWDPVDTGVAPDVIVVEDDDALADLVTFALSARGLTWVRFSDGPAALAGLRNMRIRGRSPIVLLDVDLPGLDGFSLYERIRVERPGAFRVVFATVHASEADQLRAIRAGALDYLSKPVSLRVLMAKIGSWRASASPASGPDIT